MLTKMMTQRGRRALVKQNFHDRLLSSFEAALGVFENVDDLRARDAWKPLEKFLDSSTALEVFEERLDRHAGALEKPGTADFPGDPLYGGTLRPVDHDTYDGALRDGMQEGAGARHGRCVRRFGR